MTEFLSKPVPRPQCADAVLMIRPAAFDYNPETAVTNSLQQLPVVAGAHAHNDLARAEFQYLVNALESEGITVCPIDAARLDSLSSVFVVPVSFGPAHIVLESFFKRSLVFQQLIG